MTTTEAMELDAKLRESGFWRKWVPKDGACFFRAAADMVFGTQVRSHAACSLPRRRAR